MERKGMDGGGKGESDREWEVPSRHGMSFSRAVALPTEAAAP